MNKDTKVSEKDALYFYLIDNIIKAAQGNPFEAIRRVSKVLAPVIEKAEEVDKFIGFCNLNPFHGYRTCAGCFFRVSCAKIKSKILAEKEGVVDNSLTTPDSSCE